MKFTEKRKKYIEAEKGSSGRTDEKESREEDKRLTEKRENRGEKKIKKRKGHGDE